MRTMSSRLALFATAAMTAVSLLGAAPAPAGAGSPAKAAKAAPCPDALVVRDDARMWRHSYWGPVGQDRFDTTEPLPRGTCIMGTDRAVENYFSAGGTSGGRVTWVYRRSGTDSNYGWRDFYRITQFTYPGNPNPVTPPADTYVSGCALFNVRCFPGDQ